MSIEHVARVLVLQLLDELVMLVADIVVNRFPFARLERDLEQDLNLQPLVMSGEHQADTG